MTMVLDFRSFDVEQVVECLRRSRNPQTHHHALILLNYAASRYHVSTRKDKG